MTLLIRKPRVIDMELKTRDGRAIVDPVEMAKLRVIALDCRKTIIIYNKTHKEDVLNRACRICNELIEIIDKTLGGQDGIV